MKKNQTFGCSGHGNGRRRCSSAEKMADLAQNVVVSATLRFKAIGGNVDADISITTPTTIFIEGDP